MTAYENVVALGKDSTDAVVASVKASTAGVQELANTWFALTKANVDRTVAAAKALAAVKSPEAAFEVQSEFARTALDQTVADGKTLIDLTHKVVGEATAPIAARVNAVVALPKLAA